MPFCRTTGVDVLISEVDRSDCVTSRLFVHRRKMPDSKFSLEKAGNVLHKLARSAEVKDEGL